MVSMTVFHGICVVAQIFPPLGSYLTLLSRVIQKAAFNFDETISSGCFTHYFSCKVHVFCVLSKTYLPNVSLQSVSPVFCRNFIVSCFLFRFVIPSKFNLPQRWQVRIGTKSFCMWLPSCPCDIFFMRWLWHLWWKSVGRALALISGLCKLFCQHSLDCCDFHSKPWNQALLILQFGSFSKCDALLGPSQSQENQRL